jgi:VanZ family protein
LKPVLVPALKHARGWFILGLLIAAAILTLSLMPTRKLPDVNVSDKWQHIAGFAALAFWFGSLVFRRHYLVLAFTLTAFGVLIELLQGWTALGRQADPLDVLADVAGIVLGLILAATPLGRWAQLLESFTARGVK